MVPFLLLGRTTRIREHGEVRAVYVSMQGGSLQLGAYDLLLGMALSTKESTAMPLLSIYAVIIISCKGSIRMSRIYERPSLRNMFPTLSVD